MHASIANFECVFSTCRPDVALAVPVPFHASITAIHHHVVPKVKFSLLVQQRFLDVLLNDVSFEGAITVLLLLF